MNFQKTLENKIKLKNETNKKRKILIIDGDDQRAVETAKLFIKSQLVTPVLLVDKLHSNLTNEIIQEVMTSEKKSKFSQLFFELRKGKESLENAQKALETKPFYGMMLLKTNEVDGVVGGLNFTTSDILRAAFKVIGPMPGIKTISSAMIMHKDDEKLIFSDISVNIKPNSDQLAEIGFNSEIFAKSLGFDPKVAFLSFSTDGSAKSEETETVINAFEKYKTLSTNPNVIGEVQFDAAYVEKVKNDKYKKPSFEGKANVYIFPTLDAGNIGYKIAQRMGGYGAIGPIITGVSAPVNDLSRGATVEDVYNTMLITTLQTYKEEK
ncbi:phosphate acetyltransferase [[Mycoplasma] collis]|uniref:phosphate acetyltransferase n=1 Tax=[Mycoplasma] collis TaxID=2127 RepID=UPI00051B6372|nr:phosphate acetyltransferase [[Mycoplasma] collis]